MKVVLVFEDVPDDLEEAMAEIRVEDQSEADAPAPQLFSERVGPFAIQRSKPTTITDVDLSALASGPDLALVVRVKAHSRDNQPVEFLNTTSTVLPEDLGESVQVTLSRVR